MGAQSMLEQLLQSGLSALGGSAPGAAGRPNDLGKYATGAAAGGALALLLGSRSGRRLGGKVLKYGSVAAIGALAWKVYGDWQAQQQQRTGTGAGVAAAAPPATAAGAGPARFEALPAPQQEVHSRAMLKAMIAAAKSDGHMDDRERSLVEAELHRLEADPEVRRWVDEELRRPVEPAEVAAGVSSPEMAAEVYLASLLVVDASTTMERAYLDALAQQLQLAPALKTQLEARALAAG